MRHHSRTASFVAATVIALGVLAVPSTASAAQLSTDYPVLSVQPGQKVTFDLSVQSTRTERVSLGVGSKPAGWQVSIRGGGSRIGAVSATADSSPKVEVSVDVPEDAKPGSHRIVINASAASGDDRLVLDLRVAQQGAGTFRLSSEFPSLQGASDETFTFDVELHNTTGQEATFNLTAQGPRGWSVDASPQLKEKASAVQVDADASATIQVTADPPDSAPAGKYPIRLSAQGSGQSLQTKLVAEVTGSADLSLQTPSERLNASGSAGATTDLQLLVRNEGSAPLHGVQFSASPPTDWEVSFEPEKISSIAPGKTVRVSVHATPAGDAITGDYVLTLTASSQSGDDSVDIRYTVETSSWWWLVGIVVIAVAVVGLLWAFRRFGRR